MNPDRARWNLKYGNKGHNLPSIPVIMYQGRLTRGRALDVAGGVGETAVVLALAGWTVTLADISDVAVARATKRARELKTEVRVVQADALRLPFRGPFETIVVTRFLERSIAPELVRLLAPGGTILCEQSLWGIAEKYCVHPDEYRQLFPDLELVFETVDGDRAVYIGRKKA